MDNKEEIIEQENMEIESTSSNLTRKERVKMIKEEKKQAKKAQKVRKKIVKRSNANKGAQVVEEDSDLPKKPSTKKLSFKQVLAIIIVVVLLFGTVMLIMNADLVSCDNISNFVQYGIFNKDKDEKFPVSIQGSTISNNNFDRMGNYLCYTSDTIFSVVNNYGKTTFSTPITFTKPVMAVSDERALIYNLGEKEFEICSKNEVLYQAETEKDILVASINDEGDYALVTECDGYLSKLFIYNELNKQQYAYSFADYYITSVSINSNGTRAILSGLSALEGKEISSIYVLDITKEEPICFHEYEGNIIYKVSFLGDNNGCAIGSKASYGFKTSNDEFNEYKYEGKNLTAYAINRNSNNYFVSVSRSGDGRNCDILSFKANGDLSKDIETDLQITSLTAYKNRVAALSSSYIYLYTTSGNRISKTSVGLEPHAIVLYTRKDAYILGVSDISNIGL